MWATCSVCSRAAAGQDRSAPLTLVPARLRDPSRYMQACTAKVLRTLSARLANSMGQQPLPLAKAVPLVAALGGELLSSPPGPRPQLARLEPVRSLSARVYGCCYCSEEAA